MLPVLNTDLDLSPRKDTKFFVFELCMEIYSYSTLQTNFPISYVASLESYVHEFYTSVPCELRTKHSYPR